MAGLIAMTRRPTIVLAGRQLEVLELLCDGLVAKEIAGQLGVSHWTVRGYIATARKRTDSRTTAQLVARFRHRIPRSPDREPAPAI